VELSVLLDEVDTIIHLIAMDSPTKRLKVRFGNFSRLKISAFSKRGSNIEIVVFHRIKVDSSGFDELPMELLQVILSHLHPLADRYDYFLYDLYLAELIS
jgi:hypothetical protein